jgi:hypothetical protein
LIYFLMQSQPLSLNLFLPFSQSEPILFSTLYTLIFTMSKVVGGILFGITFWFVAKNLTHSTIVRDYMIMSSCGFVLLFVSNQAFVLISAPAVCLYIKINLQKLLFSLLQEFIAPSDDMSHGLQNYSQTLLQNSQLLHQT